MVATAWLLCLICLVGVSLVHEIECNLWFSAGISQQYSQQYTIFDILNKLLKSNRMKACWCLNPSIIQLFRYSYDP